MALALHKENYFWHKLHSLSGIVPVGFYMVQHLVLNSFSLVSPTQYDAVGDWFYALPPAILWFLEIFVIWIPFAFHAIYGMFIVGRAQSNFIGTRYGWSQNRMYWLQRATGVFLLVFLAFHVLTTTGRVKITGDHTVVNYVNMQAHFAQAGGLVAAFYAIGIVAASYHLAYGVWNFCIRWGITISDEAQLRIQKASLAIFAALTLLGWAALAGFFIHKAEAEVVTQSHSTVVGQLR